jgi:hypothetical protein
MDYPLEIAVVDFVPNLAYLTGAFFIVRLLLLERFRPCARMFMAGSLLVFLGGMLKASWKLIVAAEGPSIAILSDAQFPLLAIGFLGTLVTVIIMARRKRSSDRKTVLPAILAWKIPFLTVMTIAQIGSLGIFAYVANRRKLAAAMVCFILSLLFTLGMASMALVTQTIAIQWIEEGINSGAQISFAVGAYLLYRQTKLNPPVSDPSSC